MTCFEDYDMAVSRRRLEDDNVRIATRRTFILKETYGHEDEEISVAHPLLVFLPDLEPSKEFPGVVAFLSDEGSETFGSSDANPSFVVRTYTHGSSPYDPRYRSRKDMGTGVVPIWKLLYEDANRSARAHRTLRRAFPETDSSDEIRRGLETKLPSFL